MQQSSPFSSPLENWKRGIFFSRGSFSFSRQRDYYDILFFFFYRAFLFILVSRGEIISLRNVFNFFFLPLNGRNVRRGMMFNLLKERQAIRDSFSFFFFFSIITFAYWFDVFIIFCFSLHGEITLLLLLLLDVSFSLGNSS